MNVFLTGKDAGAHSQQDIIKSDDAESSMVELEEVSVILVAWLSLPIGNGRTSGHATPRSRNWGMICRLNQSDGKPWGLRVLMEA